MTPMSVRVPKGKQPRLTGLLLGDTEAACLRHEVVDRRRLKPVAARIDLLTRAEAQAVIDRLRFHREVRVPLGLPEE